MFTWSPAGAVQVAVRLSRRALVPLLVLSLLVSPAAPTWAASPAATGVVKNASLPSQLTIAPKQEDNPADQPNVPTAEATPGEEVPPAPPATVPASVQVDVSSRLAVVTAGEPFTVTVSVAPTSMGIPLAAGLTIEANLSPGVVPADGAAGTELSWTLPALTPGTAQTQTLQLVADGSATLLGLEVVVTGEDVLPVMQLHWLAVAPASAVTEEPTATPAATPTPLAQATLSPTATATEVSATPTAEATAPSLTAPAVAMVDTPAEIAGETPATAAASSTPEPIPPTATPTLPAPAALTAGTEAGIAPLPDFYAASVTSAEVGTQGAVVQSNSGGVTLALGAGAMPAGAVVAYAPLWDWHSSAPPATPPVTPTELPTAEAQVPEPASLAHLFLPSIEGSALAQATGTLLQVSDSGDNGEGDAPAVPGIEEQGITFYTLWTLDAHTATPARADAEVAAASTAEIEQLSAEALLVVSVADLAAEGIDPQQLQLWTREETGEPWTALAATYDADAQVLRAWLPHFSQFGLGAGLSPSGDLLPSVQAFTADVLTGGATASIPIDAPAGLGGLKPNLGLSYSSVLMDDLYRKGGANNMTAQGGAAGFGWNLGGVSYIARSDGKLDDDTADTLKTFAMVLGGERVEISYMSGAWHTNPEIFARIDWPGDRSGEAYDFAGWTVTTSDGTRYEFGDTGAFAGFATTSANAYTLERTTGGLTYRLTRRWYLRKVTDALGNSMQYSYKTERAYKTCSVEQQWINNGSNWYTSSVDPLEIAYSGNAGVGAEYRLRVQFVYGTGARGDTQVENWSPSGCNSTYPSQPMVGSYNQLSSIAVQVKNVSATWQTIKSYDLVQYAQAFSAGSTKYRYYLAYLYEKGLAGGTLRRYSFTYNFSNLNQVWLTNADNSWGGSVGYSYAAYRISCSNSVCPNTMFRYPVATTIAYDAPYPPPAGVSRNSVQTSYSYGPVNSPGSEGGAVANDGGFLGFKEVTVLHYDVNSTTSLLQKEVVLSYQDGAQASRDNPDPRQGKVKQRTVYAGDGTTVLQAQQYDWQAYWYLNGAWSGTPTTTSWRLNNGEAQYPPTWTQLVTETVTLGTPGSGAPWTQTVYAYKTAQQNGGQYGNRTTASEYVDNALKRRTETEYYPNTTAYIVDKPARVRVYDAAGSCVREVRSVYDRYDDNNNFTLTPVVGLLAETAQALAACSDVAAINKGNAAWQIERFAYDSYGNQTVHHLVGAGDGSQDQWTDTDYDATFHLFPVKRYDAVRPEIQETATYHGVNAPAVTSGWVYWGAMAEWCDVNGICTRQAYDQFGRRIFGWDNQVRGSAWPTASTGAAVRWDYRDPYNNPTWQEVTVAEWRAPRCYGNFVRRHYNGFGQLTQEQKPNQGWEAVVAGECGAVTAGTEIDVDYAYDGLGRQVKVSVPHATAAGWVNRPPDWSYGASSTAYDALGRVTTTTAPNGEQTLTTYSGRATKVVGSGRSGDPNKVLQWTEVDGFGNLSNVRSGSSTGAELARDTRVRYAGQPQIRGAVWVELGSDDL